jgi:hypothetical protein
MERVAKHLEEEAVRRHNADEIDVFARSAFNRFYYACYRIVWKLHTRVYPGERVPAHTHLPEIIEGKLYRRYLDRARGARRNRLISDADYQKLRHKVRELTASLSNLLREGYAVRCVADYEPDKRIANDGKRLMLESTSLPTAVRWVERVSHLCGNLLSEWKSLGN